MTKKQKVLKEIKEFNIWNIAEKVKKMDNLSSHGFDAVMYHKLVDLIEKWQKDLKLNSK